MTRSVAASRRPFTLIELLIAVTLSVMLLTSLFGFYRYLSQSGADLAEQRQETFLQRQVQNRLTFTLMEARAGSTPIFYMDESENEAMRAGSLLFVFDRGVDLRPELSERLLCRLYLDQDKRLCLAYWPEPYAEQQGSQPFRHEVLLDQVDVLSFRFFSPPDFSGEVLLGDVSRPPPGEWVESWSQEYGALPALTEVLVERKGLQLRFAFPMLYSKPQIIYRE